MNIPESGRVVIVDDIPDEGLPLLRSLSAKGIPATYFTGNIEELPDTQLPSVRILFLDIVLETEGQDDKTKISKAISVIDSIVDRKSGPFLVVAWTKHEELIEGLKRVLKEEGFQFILINLEKNECRDNEGKYNINTIGNKLEEKLREIGCFHLFIIWENLVHKSSGTIVTAFTKFHDFDEDWNKNMSGVFLKLAEGFAGKQLDKSNNEQIVKNALFSFNSTFLDALESEIRNYEPKTIALSFDNVSARVSPEIIGDINSKLLLAMESSKSILPGNVYKDDVYEKDDKARRSMIYDLTDAYKICLSFAAEQQSTDVKDICDEEHKRVRSEFRKEFEEYSKRIRNEIDKGSEVIVVEVTPYCDYAQKKWKASRIVKGFLWPDEYEAILKKSDFSYISPIISYNGNLYYVVLDLRYFSSIDFSKLGDKNPLFRLKHHILIDIQSKLAAHINRPGVMSVE
ncbi:hypothetical protein FJZ31_04625 [Candidatus Poribacteria bacterium]|nr:hypothetical protein [Candidatus Poribacteria bacterium]